MTAPEGVAGVFDRAADTYDDVGVPWFEPIALGLVEELAVQPGERVLDIGCGRGAALRPLALATGPTGHALGIDLAPRMVERTAEDLRGLPQVEVRVGDARAPAVPAASFDVVASSLVLFFMPDPPAALRAWVALLVPGGRIGITTFGTQDGRWSELDGAFTAYLPPAMLDARTSGLRGPFASDEAMEELLVDAGVGGVRTVHGTVTAAFRDAEHYLAFTWSHGQRGMWEAVPAAERPAVRTLLLERLDPFRDGDGAIRLEQEVRYTLGQA
ncbi:class I SAM-dependent methyltransferase [Cellulomonas sp. McL0617]|uniref:class I SAM-dependent methyltransferase n=1 Tax=Cellulomonas sp. McL0617 TaxID=3415675 RepID=UPI003CFB58DE